TKLLRKMWNVQQFIGNVIKKGKPKETKLLDIDKWILSKYSKLVKKCTDKMDVFDYSQSMKEIEYFLWHELADHYIEMIKSSIYDKKNIGSIHYTLYTIGLGILKLFAPFLPHITEEIYYSHYKKFEGGDSIHTSNWPKPLLIDEEKERAGETVKTYISLVRSWKSEQSIALNAPINAIATYASEKVISKLKPSSSIIVSTLKFPPEHKFIKGEPSVEKIIKNIFPIHSKIGPNLKKYGKKLIEDINNNKEEIIEKIQKNEDIPLSEFYPAGSAVPNEKIVQDKYVKIEEEIVVKDKRDRKIVPFNGFYLEIQGE
ncbi:MAG: class I tRNA ligase family protein, partial [Petrotogales bacterium]